MTSGLALSTARGVNIYVGSEIRDSLSLLDVLYANQFEGKYFDPKFLQQAQENFYRGAPPIWLNFHISEQAESHVTGFSLIKRDGYDTLVQQIQQRRTRPGVSTVKLFHQPGCGGSTLAMQVLWDLRKTFRCAVLTGSTSDITIIAKEVVQLYKTGYQGQQNTVLLLLNDEQIMENLQDNIMEEIAEQEIVPRRAVVILFSCVRKDVVLHSDHVVLERALSDTEKQKFNEKKKELSGRYTDQCQQFYGFNIMQTNFSHDYVRQACTVFSNVRKANRPKIQLAAFLALLNAYVPDSYLLESQCLDFLKHKDSTCEDLSLEDRMKPYGHLIVSFQQDTSSEKRVCMAHTMIAQSCTELMAEAGVTRSDTARNFLTHLCRDEIPPFLLGFVKRMLTKRETKKEENKFNSAETEEPRKCEKEKFSRLILDIIGFEENVQSASVLKVASDQFSQNAFFPQALARVYYLELKDYNRAEEWAKEAKKRDSQNSFIADTLGQVHKTHLKKIMFSGEPKEILRLAQKAIKAFKEEERLAENEHRTHMKGDGNSRVSRYFNTNGKFGYVEVCNIVYDIHENNVSKGLDRQTHKLNDLVNSLREDAKKYCEFLNAFLTYSKPKVDDSYNRKAVSSCYCKYAGRPLPDLVMEIVKTFRDNVKAAVSPRGDDTPESYIVALLKGWPTNSNKNSCNLIQLLEKMRNTYEGVYAKYFGSIYLCPLLYFGKDDKGALNIFVPTDRKDLLLKNEATIKYIKSTDKIFEYLRGQENLFKFNGVVKNYSIFATVGDMEIVVKACMQNTVWKEQEVSFYLGFTIRGLEAFDIQTKPTENAMDISKSGEIFPKVSACSDTGFSETLKSGACGGVTRGVTDSSHWTKLKPEMREVNKVHTYSLRSEAGHFECGVSALRWVCKEKISFRYQFCSWEDHMRKPVCMEYMPAGPLLDITITAGKMEEVHLPHWIDYESVNSDMFAVLHVDTCGDALEQVSEVTSSHVKLLHPTFSPTGVLIRMKLGWPVKIFYDVLIYKTKKELLTLHVYLVPLDRDIQETVKKEEETHGSKIIPKPSPDKSLQMLDSFFLTTETDTHAVIQPNKLKLRYERRNYFEVFIRSADGDFNLKLESMQKKNNQRDTIWTCTIRKGDYQNETSVDEQGQHFVDVHRRALINRVSDTEIILDKLMEREIISSEAYDTLRTITTTQNQMRDILKIVISAGRRAKDKFQEILKEEKSLKSLISELEGSR